MNESAANTETRVPRQVRARADKARAILNPTPSPDEPAPAVVDPPAPSAVEPSPTPTPAPAADARETDFRYWKQRFQVTEGMWKRDKERFAADRQQLIERNEALLAKVRELESSGTAAPEDINLDEFFTAEEVERLGEDQARIQARAIKVQATRIARELMEQELAPLRKRTQEDTEREQEAATAAFLTELTRLKPNWQAVNADQRWIDWLSEDDPDTGIWRQEILNRHQAANRPDRLAAMIEQWEKTLAPAAAVPPEPAVVPQGRSGSGGQPTPGTPPSPKGAPTSAEIRDFYKRKATRGVSAEEAKEFDARLKAAGLV